MIIREREHSFIMIEQHHHAFISGEIIQHIDRKFLQSTDYFESLTLSAYQHDRSWIGLDACPIWNDSEKKPFSFSDFPLLLKLAFYQKGVDEIEKMNLYAGLLCSMHFYSFFTQSSNRDCLAFMDKEDERQTRIKKELPELDKELLQQHFTLLQFSDDLSLYLCLNEPGVEKSKEHPWFIKGFKHTDMFSKTQKLLNARWLDEVHVGLDPFPFADECRVHLPYKKVSKEKIEKLGIAKAYENSERKEHSFIFTD
ncbi:DUF3891 family protein [Bacillus sp. KH172YL63]|uniref:DUF3891 family protein n=1 Tax=Bacillus sp. KH172YL63 TaxID=2709784 RepID=UPI0013E4932B|nr:DUF3891 family protein [Bacillus sp. KH172YL63]BCB04232.1 hypothetical protein KH172YL63_23650 [Bacillus sp. KH172YL63]